MTNIQRERSESQLRVATRRCAEGELTPRKIAQGLAQRYHRWAQRLQPVRPRQKVPFLGGWVAAADERDRRDGVDAMYLGWLAGYLASGFNLGWVVPPGVVVLDADTANDAANLAVHATVYKATPRGGLHAFFATDHQFKNRSREKLGDLTVDIRAYGSQVLVSPSIHPDGGRYATMIWPDAFPPLPTLLETLLLEAQAPKSQRSMLTLPAAGTPDLSGEVINTGERNDMLFRIGCLLRGEYALEHDALNAALHDVNRNRCAPPLPPREVETISNNVCRRYAAAQGGW